MSEYMTETFDVSTYDKPGRGYWTMETLTYLVETFAKHGRLGGVTVTVQTSEWEARWRRIHPDPVDTTITRRYGIRETELWGRLFAVTPWDEELQPDGINDLSQREITEFLKEVGDALNRKGLHASVVVTEGEPEDEGLLDATSPDDWRDRMVIDHAIDCWADTVVEWRYNLVTGLWE